MAPPQLTPETESHRRDLVSQLDERSLRRDESLKRIADAVTTICDVPMGHVSLMEDDYQCVVGHVGFEMDRFDRSETFCAYTVAERDVVLVEDATEDPRFEDNPFVTDDPGLRFYLGVPVMLGSIPVGTLCALDTEPHQLDRWRRSEIFGLVHSVEAHLEVLRDHGTDTAEHAVSSKLTAVRALAVKERHRQDEDLELIESLRAIQAESKEGIEVLDEQPDDGVELGAADTLPELEE